MGPVVMRTALIAFLTALTVVSHAKTDAADDVFSVAAAVNGPSNDYREVTDLALKILQSYPPGEYLYVGVGRSPTPVIAALQAILGESGAVNVPISNLTYKGRDDDWTEPFSESRFYEKNGHVLKHLDKVMPSEKDLGDKSLLLIDSSKNPKDLLQAVSAFHDFAFERNRNNKRKIKALAFGVKANAYIDFKKGDIATINIPVQLHERIRLGLYKDFAEYAPVDLSSAASAAPAADRALEKNQAFADLRAAFTDKMRTDLPFLIDLIRLEIRGLPVVRGISRDLLKEVPARSTARGLSISKCIEILKNGF